MFALNLTRLLEERNKYMTSVYFILNRYTSILILYIMYISIYKYRRPFLQYHISKHKYVTRMKSLLNTKPFLATGYGFVQSYLQLHRIVKKINRRSFYLKAPYDGEIVLDVVENNSTKNVLLVHGFNGSSSSRYILGLSDYFDREGYRIFCFNARGTKYKLKNEIFFHIGWTVDIKVAVDFILDNFEGTLEIYGFSMGASWITKYLGEGDTNTRIVKAGAICLPFDFYKIEQTLKKSFVSGLLAYNYRKYIRRNKDTFTKAGIDLPNLFRCRTLREIDSLLTKKIFNLKDLDEYYKKESCVHYIRNIKIPFLILNTSDDPIVPVSVIDREICRQNKNILLVINPWGGHLGFLKCIISGSIADEIILDFSKEFE